MKTKLILNSALSILVALGAVACSSGGGGSASAELKKPVEKAVETVKAETPKAETPKAETPKAETPKAETPKAVETVEEQNKNAYVFLTSKNSDLDTSALNTIVNEKIKRSDSDQFVIMADQEDLPLPIIYLSSDDRSKLMTLANPNYRNYGWKYQTFAKFEDTSANKFGFVSLGEKSKPSSIQNSGNATYKGVLSGYFLIENEQSSTLADVTVDVDFSTKNIAFKSENTKSGRYVEPKFNLLGTAKLDAAKNEFVDGKVHLTGFPERQGKLEGALFGPKAEEVGGTFNIENGQYIGGFGAKQK